jgi:hypothetical protein
MNDDGASISERISREVLSWPGVTAEPHRFGGVEFRLGKRELGHLHGDYLADLPFPVRVRKELVTEGRALPHHILPDSGWVSYPIRDERAVPGAIALFRLSYERARGGRGAGGALTRPRPPAVRYLVAPVRRPSGAAMREWPRVRRATRRSWRQGPLTGLCAASRGEPPLPRLSPKRGQLPDVASLAFSWWKV